MKICPYCGEEIQDSAKKCRFCGEWLKDNFIELKDGKNISVTILKVVIGILCLSVIWFGPYEFYLLSRLLIFFLSIYLAVKERKNVNSDSFRFWTYVFTIIVYNPFALVYLNRFLWTIIDIILIYLFLKFIKQHEKM